MLVFQHSSGSIRHKVKSVGIQNDKLKLDIDVIHPGCGTADMATWHIAIEIPKVGYREISLDVNEINLSEITEKDSEGQTNQVTFKSGRSEVVAYENFAWASTYDAKNESMLAADGIPLLVKMCVEEASANLPEIVLDTSLKVDNVYGGVIDNQTTVYNELFEEIEKTDSWPSAKIFEDYEAGTYYLKMYIVVQGEYIEKLDDYEASCSNYYVKIIVPEKKPNFITTLIEMSGIQEFKIDNVEIIVFENQEVVETLIIDEDRNTKSVEAFLKSSNEVSYYKDESPDYDDIVVLLSLKEDVSIELCQGEGTKLFYKDSLNNNYALDAPPWIMDEILRRLEYGIER